MDLPNDIRPPGFSDFCKGMIYASALFTVAMAAYAVAKWWPYGWE